ncbi:MAG TPA: class I SAM-dependent methyltransferase [Bacteroidales bacterium]|nr:class I SAM-dependent methyltransferase [Bacteroidales bacterium]
MLFNKSVLLQLALRRPYGVHSPFLYNLADKCIFSKEISPDFRLLEQKRKELLVDQTEIYVLDFGHGPKKFSVRSGFDPIKYRRTVSKIARNSLQTPGMCRLMWRLAKHFSPKNIIEIGTSLGITTTYLSNAAPESRIITLEGCPQTAARAEILFGECGATNVELSLGLFENTLPKALEQLEKLDMVYLDGDHSFKPVIQNFNTLLSYLHSGSVLVVDDIRWSKSMKEAWIEMASHPMVTLAVDLYKAGIIFFNPGLSKQIVPVGFNFF